MLILAVFDQQAGTAQVGHRNPDLPHCRLVGCLRERLLVVTGAEGDLAGDVFELIVSDTLPGLAGRRVGDLAQQLDGGDGPARTRLGRAGRSISPARLAATATEAARPVQAAARTGRGPVRRRRTLPPVMIPSRIPDIRMAAPGSSASGSWPRVCTRFLPIGAAGMRARVRWDGRFERRFWQRRRGI